MNHALIKTNVFHNVDFATAGPASRRNIFTQHPEGGPRTNAFREFGHRFKPAIGPGYLLLSQQPSGRVVFTLIRFFSGFNDKFTVFKAGVFGASRGVVLKLIITPAVAANVIPPPCRIGQASPVELISPNQFAGGGGDSGARWGRHRNGRLHGWNRTVRTFAGQQQSKQDSVHHQGFHT